MIKFDRVSKAFESKVVLNEISFEIKENDFVVITGESGSGKSTLLNLIGLIDIPSDGDYIFDGQVISFKDKKSYSSIRRNNFGYIFQSYHLINNMTVYENLKLPLIYKGEVEQIKRVIANKLRELDIDYLIDQKVSTLSGGEKQRVVIARVMLQNPKIIIADEPTGNLDLENANKIMELLLKLQKTGYTIILVTHNQSYSKIGSSHFELVDGVLR